MKTFKLVRHEDVKSVSGIGTVAIGVDYGTHCLMTWITDARIETKSGEYIIEHIPTLTFFKDLDSIQKLHGHGVRADVVIDSAIELDTVMRVKSLLDKLMSVAA